MIFFLFSCVGSTGEPGPEGNTGASGQMGSVGEDGVDSPCQTRDEFTLTFRPPESLFLHFPSDPVVIESDSENALFHSLAGYGADIEWLDEHRFSITPKTITPSPYTLLSHDGCHIQSNDFTFDVLEGESEIAFLHLSEEIDDIEISMDGLQENLSSENASPIRTLTAREYLLSLSNGWSQERSLLLEPDSRYRAVIHRSTPTDTIFTHTFTADISNPNLYLRLNVFNTLHTSISLYETDSTTIFSPVDALDSDSFEVYAQSFLFGIGLDINLDGSPDYTYDASSVLLYPSEVVELYVYESQTILDAPKLLFYFPARESYSNILEDWVASTVIVQADAPPPTLTATATLEATHALYEYDGTLDLLSSTSAGTLPASIPDEGGGITPDGNPLECGSTACIYAIQQDIEVETCESLSMLQVALSFQHPYRDGDLGIALLAPNQTLYELKGEDQSWSPLSNPPINQWTIGEDVSPVASFASLYGTSGAGTWSLLLWDDYDDSANLNQELIDASLLLWCE